MSDHPTPGNASGNDDRSFGDEYSSGDKDPIVSAAAGVNTTDDSRVFEASPMPNDPRSSPTRSAIAWAVVAIATATIVIATVLAGRHAEDVNPPTNDSMVELQGKYTLGAVAFMDGADPDGKSKEQLLTAINTETGTFAERLRNTVLVADLKDVDKARKSLDNIAKDIEAEDNLAADKDIKSSVTESDRDNLQALRQLYQKDSTPSEVANSLSDDERKQLIDSMGWFGELAVSPEGADGDRRNAVVSSAKSVFMGIVAGFTVLLGAGSLGLIGLILLVVNVTTGKMTMQFKPGRLDHRLYIETFAIWLVLTFLAQILADVVSVSVPESLQLVPILCVFFGSLLALGWPVLCGAKFADVCRDIGWSLPKPVWATPVYGVAGYFMALPMVAVGLLLTLFLMFLVSLFGDTNSSTPTHPIFSQLTAGQPLLILQVFLLGSVAAPIVEETMFRGVLYRNLRDASRTQKLLISVLFSAILSSFIFAAIHPQGIVTIPALMSLAIAFALARELLDSLVPSMIMHGVSNALVMTLGLSIFG